MSDAVDHLAILTAHRDRDALDVTLASGLRDLLRPQEVAIHRCVGDGTDQRWLLRARLAAGDLAARADPAWRDHDELPRLTDFPERAQCLQHEQAMEIGPGPTLSLFPLCTERDSTGVLEIRSAQPLCDRQMRLVGSMLRVLRNFQDLIDDSERDPLTGLLNRTTFDESFLRATVSMDPAHRRVAATGQRREPAAGTCWLGIIDIDHFKRVNDAHGHLIGDEVLLLLSRLLRAGFRYHDRLYRFGGEEFVVLMRCASAANAAQAFERLRSQVEACVFPRAGHITVSIGFTQVRRGDTPISAFDRADRAVYHAKAHGRNQVASDVAPEAGACELAVPSAGAVELFEPSTDPPHGVDGP